MDARPRPVFLSPKGIALALAMAAATALLLLFVWATQTVLIWILIALFLALALDHVVCFLERRLPRATAAVVTFVAALLAIAAIGYLVVPPLVDEVRAFADQVPAIVDRVTQGQGTLGDKLQGYIEGRGVGGVLGLTGSVLGVLQSAATVAIGIFAVIFLTLFMLISGRRWVDGIVSFAPEGQTELWRRIGSGIRHAVGGWVIGAVFLGVLAGTSATVVLLILGVPYALALGLIVGVLDPVPFVGVTVAGIVVGAAAYASEGLVAAAIFIGFMIAYQQLIENHVLVPLVYSRTVELSALAVLIAVLLGGELAGILGAIAAIPVTGALKSTANEILAWRRARAVEVVEPWEVPARTEERSRSPVLPPE